MRSTKVITALDAVTATTVSKKFFVGDASRIALLVRRANHSSGSTAFSVKISCDPVTTVTPVMTTYNMLIDNLTNTNGQMPTRIASKSLAADSDAYLFFDDFVKFNWIEITATETTDGTHSAFILVEHES